MDYSYYCFNSTNCFGCAGLRKKNYYILNKEYSKEEFDALRVKIIADMRVRGEYGNFFPARISTFGYNESAAQEQFPLTKEEALASGFKWEDAPRGTYGKETIQWDSVSSSFDDIQKEVFACTVCKKNFRVIAREYDFYKKLSIPLPRLCPDCRHARRFVARGPNRTWTRTCMCEKKHAHHSSDCSNIFETSFAPDRPEIVYCEACYNTEVI